MLLRLKKIKWPWIVGGALLIVFVIVTAIVLGKVGLKVLQQRLPVKEEYFGPDCRIVYFPDGRMRLYNTEFNWYTTSKLNWIASPHYADTLSVFSENGRRGYLNMENGRVQIEPKYSLAWHFSEGLAAVVYQGRLGFIDRNGKTRIPFRFYSPYPIKNSPDLLFKGGYCIMRDTCGRYGLIDHNGNWAIQPIYEYINNPVLGYRIVRSNRKYGLLDAELNELLPCAYDYIAILKNGLQVFKDGVQQLISHDTKRVIKPFVYDMVVPIQYDSGELDKDGNPIIKPTACLAYNVYSKWGLMRKDGKVLTKAIYSEIKGLGYDLFSCYEEVEAVTLNAKGKEVH